MARIWGLRIALTKKDLTSPTNIKLLDHVFEIPSSVKIANIKRVNPSRI
jgi:hypothetical protein